MTPCSWCSGTGFVGVVPCRECSSTGSEPTGPAFRPSDVVLQVPIPFIDTFRAAEAEAAALVLVRACCQLGDRWQPVSPGQAVAAARADLDAELEPMLTMASNPFIVPRTQRLVRLGFARYVGEEDDAPVEFTEAGFKALEGWVRPSARGVR